MNAHDHEEQGQGGQTKIRGNFKPVVMNKNIVSGEGFQAQFLHLVGKSARAGAKERIELSLPQCNVPDLGPVPIAGEAVKTRLSRIAVAIKQEPGAYDESHGEKEAEENDPAAP